MSKNITVIPQRYKESRTFYKSHGVAFDRSDYDRYDQLDERTLPLPEDWGVCLECDGDDERKDPYGDEIKMVTVQDFIKIYDVDNFNHWDKACMAFLKALPPHTLCAIYYH